MTSMLIQHFPKDIDQLVYVEGCGGGASLLFAKEPVSREVYNDINQNVYAFFLTLASHACFQSLKSFLDITPYSRELHTRFRKQLADPTLSYLDRAARFFYVNRTSFNGNGGFSRNLHTRRGMLKCVSDYLSTVDNLEQFHQRMSRVLIEQLDVIDLVKRYDREEVFLYLDPPYIHETRKGNDGYDDEMTTEHHHDLAKALVGFSGKVMLSGYRHSAYSPISHWRQIEFTSKSANSNGQEVLWLNYE